MAGHGLDQAGGDIARVSIHDPDPGEVGDRRDEPVQQGGQPIPQPQIATIVTGVLGNEDDLADAASGEVDRIGDDLFGRPADGGALDRRDRAERTGPATPVGDLEIGAGTLDGRADHTPLIQSDRVGLGRQVNEPAVAAELVDKDVDIHPAPGPQNAVQAGDLPEELRAGQLGEAAGRHQPLTRALDGRQLAQRIHGLVAGGADETAGIDDQQIGLGRIGRPSVPGTSEQLAHPIRIDGVLGAAQTKEIVTTSLHHRGERPISPRRVRESRRRARWVPRPRWGLRSASVPPRRRESRSFPRPRPAHREVPAAGR